MRKIIVTAFEPFGQDKVNPTIEANKLIFDKFSDVEVVKLTLPVVFEGAFEILEREIRRVNPVAVFCLGLAGGRRGVTIERVAINLDDARIADNNNNQPIDKAIVPNGKNAYFSNLPIKRMLMRMNELKVEGSISNTAGTYVCNNIMYRLLHYIEENKLDTKGGFIHIPYAIEYVEEDRKKETAMEVKKIAEILESIIEVGVNYNTDSKITGGKIC